MDTGDSLSVLAQLTMSARAFPITVSVRLSGCPSVCPSVKLFQNLSPPTDLARLLLNFAQVLTTRLATRLLLFFDDRIIFEFLANF